MKLFASIILVFLFSQAYSQNGMWNYTVSTESSNPISMSGAAIISPGGDDITVNFNWPFNAWIYNDYYKVSDTLYLNSNGIMRFDRSLWEGAGRASAYPVFPTNDNVYGQCISYGGNTDGHISGDIKQKVSGVAGSYVLTIAFTYFTHYSGTTAYHADIQISFYESNRNIRIDYSNVGGSTNPALHLGVNAGDSIWGADYAASFPSADIAYLFTPGPIVSINHAEFSGSMKLAVMPNPSIDIFKVQIESSSTEGVDVVVFNAIGQSVFSEYVNNSETHKELQLDLSNYPKGIYYLRVQSKSKMTISKLILQ